MVIARPKLFPTRRGFYNDRILVPQTGFESSSHLLIGYQLSYDAAQNHQIELHFHHGYFL